jgi:phenylacetate-CoA ligase
MLSKGLKLDYEPRCLVLSSEKTTPAMKEVIAEAFRARAYEEYGSVENCALATECEYGSLHVSADFGVVEIVNDRGEPAEAGCHGGVLCTGLLNDAQPLIRYEIGDVASWSRVKCQCGRDQLPVLAGIEGRLEDAVVGPDGRELVRFHGLFINVKGVVEAQVVQEQIDMLRVRVVSTPEFGEPERSLIEQRVHERLGPLVRVVVESAERIERTNRGKFRAVISRVPRPAVQPASGRGAP